MGKILKMIEKLVKPRTIFTGMFFGTTCYLILNNIAVPEMLNSIVSGLFGYYYGEKTKKEINNNG